MSNNKTTTTLVIVVAAFAAVVPLLLLQVPLGWVALLLQPSHRMETVVETVVETANMTFKARNQATINNYS